MSATAQKQTTPTVEQVAGILRGMAEADVIQVLEVYRGLSATAAKERDPFYQFAFDAEDPLLQSRAEMCAVSTILSTRKKLDEELTCAVSHLIAATWIRLESLIEARTAAFVENRRAA